MKFLRHEKEPPKKVIKKVIIPVKQLGFAKFVYVRRIR